MAPSLRVRMSNRCIELNSTVNEQSGRCRQRTFCPIQSRDPSSFSTVACTASWLLPAGGFCSSFAHQAITARIIRGLEGEAIAVLIGEFARAVVEGDAAHENRFASAVELDTAPGGDPAHPAVRQHHAIFPFRNCLRHGALSQRLC